MRLSLNALFFLLFFSERRLLDKVKSLLLPLFIEFKFNAQLAKRVKLLYPKVQVKSQNKYGQSKYVYDGCHLTNEGIKMYINNVLSVVTRFTQ